MWYVIDKENNLVVGRYYSYYMAEKSSSEYDGKTVVQFI